MEMVDKLLEERGEAVKEEEEGKDINSNFQKCSHCNECKHKSPQEYISEARIESGMLVAIFVDCS